MPVPAYLPAVQLASVVAERERGLRQALKTMGMLESGALRGETHALRCGYAACGEPAQLQSRRLDGACAPAKLIVYHTPLMA